MIVREFLALLGLQVDEASFEQADAAFEALERTMLFMGAAAAGAAASVASLVSHALEVERSAATTGVTTERYQELGFAAEAAGLELDELRDILADLSDKAIDSTDPTSEMGRLFKQAGVDARAMGGGLKSADIILEELAESLAGMEDATKRTGIASQLLGETGMRILPSLLGGKKGLADLAEQARDFGYVLDTGTLRAASELGQQFGRLRTVGTSLVYSFAAGLLPVAREVVDRLMDWASANREVLAAGIEAAVWALSTAARVAAQYADRLWKALRFLAVDLHGARIAAYALAAALAIQVGNALVAVAAGASHMVVATRSLFTTMTLVTTAAGTQTQVFKLLTAAQLRAMVVGAAAPAAIAAAWAAAFGVLFLIAEDVYTFFEGGDSVFGRWGKWITDAITIREDDNALVRFIKWMGMSLFDMQGWAITTGSVISRAFNAAATGITGYFRGVEKMLQNLFAGRFREAGAQALEALGPVGWLLRQLWGLLGGVGDAVGWLEARVVNLLESFARLSSGDIKGSVAKMLEAHGPVGDWMKSIRWTDDGASLSGWLGERATQGPEAAASLAAERAPGPWAPTRVITNAPTFNQQLHFGPGTSAAEVGPAVQAANRTSMDEWWATQLQSAIYGLQGG